MLINNPNWKGDTSRVERVDIEIHFVAIKRYSWGKNNNPNPIRYEEMEFENLYIPYGKPDIRINTQLLKDNMQELITYYEHVLELQRKHHNKLSGSFFWLRLNVYNPETGRSLVDFPWTDTLTDMELIFKALSKDKDGLLYDDQDQCWEFTAEQEGNILYMRQANPDDYKIIALLSIDKQLFMNAFEDELANAKSIVQKLTKHFGNNYWSNSYWRRDIIQP